jgi:hypothetical protein
VNFGRYLSEKNAPNAQKYRPNGEISPNLVTLAKNDPFFVQINTYGNVSTQITM